MTEPWALHATAADFGAAERAALRVELETDAELRRRAILLVTCHRVEVYGFGPRPAVALPASAGRAAALRIARIAAGLESATLGEDEVLHQVRGALTGARRAGLADTAIARLFETAIAAGRRARAQRRPRTLTLEERALAWLRRRAAGRRLLVVGRGDVGSRLAATARRLGWSVTVASRRAAPGDLDLAGAALAAAAADAVAVALSGPWVQAPVELPPVADLSSPPALPAHSRPRDRLEIDELFAAGLDDPEYRRTAEWIATAAADEFMSWLEARRRNTA